MSQSPTCPGGDLTTPEGKILARSLMDLRDGLASSVAYVGSHISLHPRDEVLSPRQDLTLVQRSSTTAQSTGHLAALSGVCEARPATFLV